MASTNPENEANPAGNKKLMLVVTERDIVFTCPSCQGELVVDLAGAGMEVPCSHCGHLLKVPEYAPRPPVSPASVKPPAPGSQPAAPAPTRQFDFSDHTPEQAERRLGELAHQLKENRSQDTEMRGHVNRAMMELHRLQLRLKKLQERHADIEAELAALRSHANGAAS